MIRFLFGRAVSGKTTTILSEIKNDVDLEQKQVVLLVPEQSSFEYERSLLRILGDGRFTNVPVLSFTRLLDEVGRNCGGIGGKHLTDCGQTILMSRAVRAVSENLSVFSKYVGNTSFLTSLIDIIDEFKRSGIDSEALRDYAEKAQGMLSLKLKDIALVYDSYDGIKEGTFIDASDDMARLDKMLSEYAYFAEKTVYIDSFKNFTGAQLKVLEHIIRTADEVVFSFCHSGNSNQTVFMNVCETVRKIENISKKHGVEIAPPTVLDKNYYSSEELSALERVLSGMDRTPYTESAENITVCEAETLYDEAEFVANEIRRLVREEGYRYRDFVVFCRDDETYRSRIENICGKYSVPCFKDKRHSIDHTPLPVFLQSAMKAADRYHSEDILRFLKTELADLSFKEISELENYVYIWKIEGEMWKNEWTMSPSGFDGFNENDEKKLAELNELRKRARF